MAGRLQAKVWMVLLGLTVMMAVMMERGSCFEEEMPRASGTCKPTGHLPGNSHKCKGEHGSECCQSGREYPQYKCSPPVTGHTRATMTVNGFQKGEDGGGPPECDGDYRDDDEKVVALSTGWYAGGSRCNNFINIHANGRTVRAMVVDECDSVNGCDSDHNYEPPCANNIVDASPGVWRALGLDDGTGEFDITWSDD